MQTHAGTVVNALAHAEAMEAGPPEGSTRWESVQGAATAQEGAHG